MLIPDNIKKEEYIMKLKVKLVFTMFLCTVISTIIAGSVLAGPSISGNNQVYPGRTYTYTVTITENASYIDGSVTTSGSLGSQTKEWDANSSSGLNENITASATITVTIPLSAAVGSTGTITVTGQGQKVDPDTNAATSFAISGSKIITVVAPSSTPTPPTAWELAIEDIKKTEEGGNLTLEMNPEDSKEFNVPIEVFRAIKTHKLILTIDYGSFKITISGDSIGEIPDETSEVNVGITLLEAQNDSDIFVFDLNYKANLFYIAEYSIQSSVIPQGEIIYVYRNYQNIGVLEYVNEASLDIDDNLVVKVFAPGSYILSDVSIEGSEGNIDEDTFIELSATPAPQPTTEPTPTVTPSIEPTEEPDENSTAKIALPVWVLVGILVIVITAFGIALVVGINRQNKRQIE